MCINQNNNVSRMEFSNMKIITKQRGFTIIEVMVAMAIFIFGILGVLELQQTANNNIAMGHMRTQMLSVANTKLVQLEGAGYDELSKYLDVNKSLSDAAYPIKGPEFVLNKNGEKIIKWQAFISKDAVNFDMIKIKLSVASIKEDKDNLKTELVGYVTK